MHGQIDDLLDSIWREKLIQCKNFARMRPRNLDNINKFSRLNSGLISIDTNFRNDDIWNVVDDNYEHRWTKARNVWDICMNAKIKKGGCS